MRFFSESLLIPGLLMVISLGAFLTSQTSPTATRTVQTTASPVITSSSLSVVQIIATPTSSTSPTQVVNPSVAAINKVEKEIVWQSEYSRDEQGLKQAQHLTGRNFKITNIKHLDDQHQLPALRLQMREAPDGEFYSEEEYQHFALIVMPNHTHYDEYVNCRKDAWIRLEVETKTPNRGVFLKPMAL